MVKGTGNSYFENAIGSYQKGIALQREKFKEAKHDNDYDSMCDSIENIKSEIKQKMINKNLKEELKKIERICRWYREKETKCIKNTPEGKKVIFPPNFHNTINHNLTIAYEVIINALELLELL